MGKYFIINGGPRRRHNTEAMCNAFADGLRAGDPSAEIKTVDLYSLSYKGCRSCFGCKRIKGGVYGKCIYPDEIKMLLEEIPTSDGIAIASPIYFGDMTGQTRAFIERLLFPLFTYEVGYRSIAPKPLPVCMIYTMNVKEEQARELGYFEHLQYTEDFIGHVFSKPKRVCACNTYQFDNYNNYVVEAFSEPEKRLYQQQHFPLDLQAAYNAGFEMPTKN